MEKRNIIKYISHGGLVLIAHLFVSGSIMQSYLAYEGLRPWQISTYTSLLGVIQIIAMAILFLFADRIKNPKKTVGLCLYIMSLFFVILIPASLLVKNPDTLFTVIIISAVIYCVCYAVRSILDYRIPYEIMDMRNYANVVNASGIINYILSAAVGFVFTVLVARVNYDWLMLSCFGISILCLIGAGSLMRSLKSNNYFKEEKKPSLFEVLREKSLFHLAPLHFFRGVTNGTLQMAAVIFLHVASNDTAASSALAIILPIGNSLGCFLYMALSKNFRTTLFTMVGGLTAAVSLILLTLANVPVIFYIIYFVGSMGMILVDNSIPVFVTEIVSGKVIGSYTTVRMLITTAGMSVGNLLVGLFVENNILTPGVVIVSVLAIVATAGFYVYDRIISNKRKAGNENE